MRALIAHILAAVLLLTAAAPAFAANDVVGAHALGCDMSMGTHPAHMGMERAVDVVANGAGDGTGDRLPSCPLAASCTPALFDHTHPLMRYVVGIAMPQQQAIPDVLEAALRELDPPPPRRI